MENHQVPNGKRTMEEELITGRDMANQILEALVHDKLNTHLEKEEKGSKSMLPFVEDLVRKVLCSFTNTLLILNSNNDFSLEMVASITPKDVSSSTSSPKLESTDETCKSPNTRKRRRGYKRKSTAPTWEKDSSILSEDGYGWRKYGQKKTSNAKYLRSYYRCTHKNDQGCQAMKQVQRIEDDPPLYRTTYYGHHTCRSTLNPEILLELLSPSSASSTLLSFNNTFQSKQENPFSSSLLASAKHEPVEFNIHHDYHSAQNQLSSPEDLLLYDYEIYFDYSKRATMLSSAESVEYENMFMSSLDFDC